MAKPSLLGTGASALAGAKLGTAIAPGLGTAIGAGLGIASSLFGGESEQERQARLLQEMAEREAIAAERDAAMLETDTANFLNANERLRRQRLGLATAKASREARSMFDRIIRGGSETLARASEAAAAGLNLNVSPALAKSFDGLAQGGADIERVRAGEELGAESNFLQGLSAANAMQRGAADVRRQAANIRLGGQRELAGMSNQFSDSANQVANALSIAALGESVNDLFKPTNEVDTQFGRSLEGLPTSREAGRAATGGTFEKPFSQNETPSLKVMEREPMAITPYNRSLSEAERLRGLERAFEASAPMRLRSSPQMIKASVEQLQKMDEVLEQMKMLGITTQDLSRAAYGIQRRALGGKVKAGEPYVVGDSPDGVPTGNEEVFVPDQDGTIVPSKNTQERMGLMGDIINAIDATPDEITMKLLKGTGLEHLLGVSRKMRKRSTSLV